MKGDRILPKEELFCQYYAKSGVAFGNQTKSYGLAFGKDLGDDNQNKVCQVLGNRLLGKVKIYQRCEQLLNEKINDEIVDKELAKVIQQGENLHAKVSAISEYNKVRGRITAKIKHKFEGVSDETLKERLADIVTGSDGDSEGVGDEKAGE